MMTDTEIEKAVIEFRPLADWWASRIQWSEEDHEDLVQEGLFWLFKTLKGYQKSGKPINDLQGLASACLSCAIKWYYKRSDREMTFVEADDKTLKLLPPVEGDEYFGDVWTQEYLEAVGQNLGPEMRTVAGNLLAPGPEVIQAAMAEMVIKAEQHREGKRVVGHSTLRITNEHVRRVSNLTEGQWQKTLGTIRKFTKEYLVNHGELQHSL